MCASELLKISDLKVSFYTGEGRVKALNGVTLSVEKGRTLGLVGESGCGKSVTALSVLRLVRPPGKIEGGRITLGGHDVLSLTEQQLYGVRGSEVSMVFQEPMTSMNPVYTVGDQVAEAIMAHQQVSDQEARNRTIEMFEMVGLPEPELRYRAYPHECSGGMRQRVMIAMALVCRPKLLIADEPTSALDVTIQAQILELLDDLRERMGMDLLLISHDLGMIAEMAEDVAVMYAGEVVEMGSAEAIFGEPLHPYTQALLSSIPTLKSSRDEPLKTIRGSVVSPLRLPPGCYFAQRCSLVMDVCREQHPTTKTLFNEQRAGAHEVRCWLHS